ncbi:orotidine 5'-phosphate decarboxylase / HUMPS family protein [Streptomyces sp. enrichment culture]|uniref:orotidine 5'-phosphate decarboxylase / HUMPS family protein n=1 Tax=Streptomyces sp. enrichment culture TaxID=1795815 RepID=UPI003F545510
MRQQSKQQVSAAWNDNGVANLHVTSMTDSDLADIGVGVPVRGQVLRLAGLAEQAGCHGVIASPQEVSALRGLPGGDALIVTPGVALPGDSPVEHARPGTPRAAIAAGASHVVVGRKVTRAVDPASAFRLVRGGLRRGGGVRRPRSARLRR